MTCGVFVTTNDARRGRREGSISLNALRCFAAMVEGGSISRWQGE
jgi:hypothetical protein